jgi:hydrogenase maturation protease
MKTLVLGLGNDLLGDDGIGLAVIEALRAEVPPAEDVDLVASPLSGLALLDLFVGYDHAVVVDGIRTGRRPPGSVVELDAGDLDRIIAPSPHYTGLPELLAVARSLDLHFPSDVRILAVETEDPYTVGGAMSESVHRAIPAVAARIRAMLPPPQGGGAPGGPAPGSRG